MNDLFIFLHARHTLRLFTKKSLMTRLFIRTGKVTHSIPQQKQKTFSQLNLKFLYTLLIAAASSTDHVWIQNHAVEIKRD